MYQPPTAGRNTAGIALPPVYAAGTGMSPGWPPSNTVAPPEMYQPPVEGRYTARSVCPSPLYGAGTGMSPASPKNDVDWPLTDQAPLPVHPDLIRAGRPRSRTDARRARSTTTVPIESLPSSVNHIFPSGPAGDPARVG